MDINSDGETTSYRQGYLQRKRTVTKSSKKKWYSLNSDAFLAFKSSEDAKIKDEYLEVLPLVDVQTVKKQYTNSQKYPFEIITQQRTHVFMTESAYEQDQWVKAFHEAMKLRCFGKDKEKELAEKYNLNKQDRRSSTGARKLSQLKKYMSEGWRPGASQRKSSGVDCDANEGTSPEEEDDIIRENDDVFENGTTSPDANTSCPQTVQYVTVHENGAGEEENREQCRASDDSGQGSHDVRPLEAAASNVTSGENSEAGTKEDVDEDDDGDVDDESVGEYDNVPRTRHAKDDVNKDGEVDDESVEEYDNVPRTTRKRIYPDEKIYDEPATEDNYIYDIPPREDVSTSGNARPSGDTQPSGDTRPSGDARPSGVTRPSGNTRPKSRPKSRPRREAPPPPVAAKPSASAMSDLKNILEADPSKDESEDKTESKTHQRKNKRSSDRLEEELTQKGVDKSAVDELKDLLDSLEEL